MLSLRAKEFKSPSVNHFRWQKFTINPPLHATSMETGGESDSALASRNFKLLLHNQFPPDLGDADSDNLEVGVRART